MPIKHGTLWLLQSLSYNKPMWIDLPIRQILQPATSHHFVNRYIQESTKNPTQQTQPAAFLPVCMLGPDWKKWTCTSQRLGETWKENLKQWIRWRGHGRYHIEPVIKYSKIDPSFFLLQSAARPLPRCTIRHQVFHSLEDHLCSVQHVRHWTQCWVDQRISVSSSHKGQHR